MTVKLNTFVSFVPPDFEMVAVSITATSPVGKAGLVTVPFVAITPTLLEAQVMVVPLEPVADKVRFCVTLTAESAPPKVITSAVLSARMASFAVCGALMTSKLNTFVSLVPPTFVMVAVKVTLVSLPR